MNRRSNLSFRSIRILLTAFALLFASALGAGSPASADVLVPAFSTGGSGGGSGFVEVIENPYVMQMQCPCLMAA